MQCGDWGTRLIPAASFSIEQERDSTNAGISSRVADAPLQGSRKVRAIPRVLYVIDQLRQLGGAERILLEMTNRLACDRYSCSVLTFDLDPSLKALSNLSVPLRVLPLSRTYDWNAVRAATELRRIIRDEKISIVHTFFETSDLWAAPIAKFSGCPILVSSRRDMGILRTGKHRLAYPLVNRLFDRVLAVSNEVKTFAIEHDRLPSQQVETLYNGVDFREVERLGHAFSSREMLGIPCGAPVITLLANVRRLKGIDVLIRSAATVCAEFPETRFLVVGSILEPDTMTNLEQTVSALGLEKSVLFPGQFSNPYPLLHGSDIFVLPSRTEGFSNALIEAMACGLPCVATRVGGNAEAIEEGSSGFLVQSEDYGALADRLLRLLRDPQMARRMGNTARETARHRFGMDAMIGRLMNIYDGLLEGKLA